MTFNQNSKLLPAPKWLRQAGKVQNSIKTLPDSPGVYLFLDKRGEILYIGKATSLRDRVKSYFNKDIVKSRGALIAKMVEEIKGVKFQKTDSVLEALILEANLIKKHQPKYNTQEKDDKSWNYVIITNENFPQILVLREHDLKLKANSLKLKAIFGPYPHGSQLKEALKIIRRIFPFLDEKSKNFYTQRFYQQIGLTPDISSEDAKKEYGRTIRHIKLFFEGKKGRLIKELEQEMKVEVKKQNFEKARELRNKIFALKHIQDVSLIKNDFKLKAPPSRDTMDGRGKSQKLKATFRIESYDVAHISGKFVVGGMVVIENGELKKSDYRKFRVKLKPGINDPAALKEIIKRRLKHKEWPFPDLISVDGGLIQKRIAESAIKESGLNIPVVSVVKDEKHKPKQILGPQEIVQKYKNELLLVNQEAHRFSITYHRKLREKIV